MFPTDVVIVAGADAMRGTRSVFDVRRLSWRPMLRKSDSAAGVDPASLITRFLAM